MITQAAFKYLLLVALLRVTTTGLPVSLLKSVMRQSSNPQDKRIHIFVRIGSVPNSPSNMTMDIALQHPQAQSPKFTCTAKLYFKPNATPLRVEWVNDETIVLSYSLDDGRLGLPINFRDCQVNQPYGNPNSSIRGLIVATNSNNFCDGPHWCKTNGLPQSYPNLNPPGSHWPWDNSRVEAISKDLFLVRYLDTEGTFKVRLYHIFVRYKELLSIRNGFDVDVVTSNLTICLAHRSDQDKIITCYQFNEKGEMEFKKSIFYSEPVVVSSIIAHSDEGLLIARSIDNCQRNKSGDCESVYVSKFSKNQEAPMLKCTDRALFQCFKNATQLEAFDVSIKSLSAMSFTSLCDYGNRYEVAESECEVIREESTVAILQRTT